MWINDGSLTKQSYAHAFAWSNESTFLKRGYIQYSYCDALFQTRKDSERKTEPLQTLTTNTGLYCQSPTTLCCRKKAQFNSICDFAILQLQRQIRHSLFPSDMKNMQMSRSQRIQIYNSPPTSKNISPHCPN